MAKARGFKNVEKDMAAKQGIPQKEAAAELATSTRRASPAAKAKNPALKKVLMPKAKKAKR